MKGGVIIAIDRCRLSSWAVVLFTLWSKLLDA